MQGNFGAYYILASALMMVACTHTGSKIPPASSWRPVENLPYRSSAIRSFTTGRDDLLEISVTSGTSRQEFLKRLDDRQQELILLGEHLTEPYFGTQRQAEGCLAQAQIGAAPFESATEIKKEIDTVADRNFQLADCQDPQRKFRAKLFFLYCKNKFAYIYAKYFYLSDDQSEFFTCDSLLELTNTSGARR